MRAKTTNDSVTLSTSNVAPVRSTLLALTVGNQDLEFFDEDTLAQIISIPFDSTTCPNGDRYYVLDHHFKCNDN